MSQEVLQVIRPSVKAILMLLTFAIAAISARPQFFASSESAVESSSLEDPDVEGRHFSRRYPYNYGRPFVGQMGGHFGQIGGHFGQMENQYGQMGGHFGPFGGGFPSNSGPHSFGTGNFGPNNNQFFGPTMGGGSATGFGLANTGFGGGSAIGLGSANTGNGGAQATGIGIANAPPGGFGMGVGLAIATPFGNMAHAQGQALSIG